MYAQTIENREYQGPYQWCSELGSWQAFDAAPELQDALTDPLRLGIASVRARRRVQWGFNTRRRQ
jgi:hypothetical protein